jgi:hypothetical protein
MLVYQGQWMDISPIPFTGCHTGACNSVTEFFASAQASLAEVFTQIVEGYVEFIKLKV